MKPKTLQKIADNRERVAELREHPHVKKCDCCAMDLDLVDEDPASTFGNFMLRDVETRIARAELTVPS